MTKSLFAVAKINKHGVTEYIAQSHGDEYWTQDVSQAILFDDIEYAERALTSNYPDMTGARVVGAILTISEIE